MALDLKLNASVQLRKIPASIWHRLARLLEKKHTTVLVVTPFALVRGAAWRVRVASNLGLKELAQPPSELLPRRHFTLLRSPATVAEEAVAQTG